MTEAAWVCTHCGYDKDNRGSWCNLGCGRDYNQMIEVPAQAINALQGQGRRAGARPVETPTPAPDPWVRFLRDLDEVDSPLLYAARDLFDALRSPPLGDSSSQPSAPAQPLSTFGEEGTFGREETTP